MGWPPSFALARKGGHPQSHLHNHLRPRHPTRSRMPNEVPVHDSLGLELFQLAQRINRAVCHVPCHHALTHTRTCAFTHARAGTCMRTDACACTCTHSVSMASQIQWQSRPHLPWRMAAPCVAAMTVRRLAATATSQPQSRYSHSPWQL